MRYLSFILAFYIAVLTVQPVVSGAYSVSGKSEKSCGSPCCKYKKEGKGKTQHSKQDRDNCCPNGMSNPFEVCACCFFNSSEQSSQKIVNLVGAEKIFALPIDSKIHSDFGLNCFHPPEGVV